MVVTEEGVDRTIAVAVASRPGVAGHASTRPTSGPVPEGDRHRRRRAVAAPAVRSGHRGRHPPERPATTSTALPRSYRPATAPARRPAGRAGPPGRSCPGPTGSCRLWSTSPPSAPGPAGWSTTAPTGSSCSPARTPGGSPPPSARELVVTVEDDIVTALWRKLVSNVVVNPITALTIAPGGRSWPTRPSPAWPGACWSRRWRPPGRRGPTSTTRRSRPSVTCTAPRGPADQRKLDVLRPPGRPALEHEAITGAHGRRRPPAGQRPGPAQRGDVALPARRSARQPSRRSGPGGPPSLAPSVQSATAVTWTLSRRCGLLGRPWLGCCVGVTARAQASDADVTSLATDAARDDFLAGPRQGGAGAAPVSASG